jgi:hypothetical protein
MLHSLTGSQHLGVLCRLTRGRPAVGRAVIFVPSSRNLPTTASRWAVTSLSRHGLPGFQLAIQSFPVNRCRPQLLRGGPWPSTVLWQQHSGELLLVIIYLSILRRSRQPMSVVGWTPVYRFPAPFRWESNKRVQFGFSRHPSAVWWTAGRGRGAPLHVLWGPLGRRPEPIDRRGPVLTGAECAHFATRGVISNHPDLADQLRPFSMPFLHVPATEDMRAEAERRQTRLVTRKRGCGGLSSVHVDLARHMQVRVSQFVCRSGMCADQHSSFVSARLHRRGAVSEGKRIGGQTYRRAQAA